MPALWPEALFPSPEAHWVYLRPEPEFYIHPEAFRAAVFPESGHKMASVFPEAEILTHQAYAPAPMPAPMPGMRSLDIVASRALAWLAVSIGNAVVPVAYAGDPLYGFYSFPSENSPADTTPDEPVASPPAANPPVASPPVANPPAQAGSPEGQPGGNTPYPPTVAGSPEGQPPAANPPAANPPTQASSPDALPPAANPPTQASSPDALPPAANPPTQASSPDALPPAANPPTQASSPDALPPAANPPTQASSPDALPPAANPPTQASSPDALPPAANPPTQASSPDALPPAANPPTQASSPDALPPAANPPTQASSPDALPPASAPYAPPTANPDALPPASAPYAPPTANPDASPPANPPYYPPASSPYYPPYNNPDSYPPASSPYYPPASSPYYPPYNNPDSYPPASSPYYPPYNSYPPASSPYYPPYTPPASSPYYPPYTPPASSPYYPPYTPPASSPYYPPYIPPYIPPYNPPYSPPYSPPYNPESYTPEYYTTIEESSEYSPEVGINSVSPGPGPCEEPPRPPPQPPVTVVLPPPDPPMIPAEPQDNRYRDMCVQTNPAVGASSFDPQTGELILDDGQPNMGLNALGEIIGAKPPKGVCVPMKTTPVNPLTGYKNDPNLAFAYFLNALDQYDYRYGPNSIFYKGFSDLIRSTSIMMGGTDYCDITLQFDADENTSQKPTIAERVDFRRAQAYNCAAQYIIRRAVEPWYVFEVQGSPLTKYTKNYYNIPPAFCQPLLSGKNAQWVLSGKYQESQVGMAVVRHVSRLELPAAIDNDVQAIADVMNENEYLLSDYLVKAYFKTLSRTGTNATRIGERTPNGWGVSPDSKRAPQWGYTLFGDKPDDKEPLGEPKIKKTNVPCVIDYGQPPILVVQVPSPPPPPPLCDEEPPEGPPPPPQPEEKCKSGGGMLPQILPYSATPLLKGYYCPNVQMIRDPSHPFSPRNDVVDYNGYPVNIGIPGDPNNPPGVSEIEGTDRKYSALTSGSYFFQAWKVGKDCKTRPIFGYNKWSKEGGQIFDPVVQCAIVPVDVLSVRLGAFNRCIGARMKANNDAFSAYLDTLAPPEGVGEPAMPNLDLFNRTMKPCSLKFYESDNGCPAKLSIQQCCHILVKDVVSMNQLTTRTCEPVATDRRTNKEAQTILKISKDTHDPKIALVEPYFAGGLQSAGLRGDGSDIGKPISLPNPESISGEPPSVSPEIPITPEGAIDVRAMEKAAYVQDIRKAADLYKISSQCDVTKVPTEYFFNHWFRSYTHVEFDKEGKPTQKSYPVGVHMPYMRWQDTGVSAGMPWKYGSFINTLGSFDYIVGVGIESVSDADVKEQTKVVDDFNKKIDSGATGGGTPQVNTPEGYDPWDTTAPLNPNAPSASGGAIGYGNLVVHGRQAGNLGGWGELMMHQMYTMRRYNLNCLGRYEKTFKEGDADNYAHYAAGGSYTSMGSTSSNDINKPSTEFTFNFIRAALAEPSKSVTYPWPLSWRGYASDFASGPGDFSDTTIPYQGINFDNAQPGDIGMVILDGIRYAFYIENVGFPKQFESYLAMVNGTTIDKRFNKSNSTWEVYNVKSNVVLGWAAPQRIYISGWNYGKFPDSTGVTNQWGTGPTRVIFRNQVPSDYTVGDSIKKITSWATTYGNNNISGSLVDYQPSCLDPDYSVCILPGGIEGWSQGMLYRPSLDPSRVKQVADQAGNLYDWPTYAPYRSSREATNQFSEAVYNGIDPPLSWRNAGGTSMFKGAGTGSINSGYYCPPGPWGPEAGSCAIPIPGLYPVPKPVWRP